MATLNRMAKSWRREDGAELIEFTLVFPVLLMTVLGIIDFGLLFQKYQVVTNAAREGARVAVLPGYVDADVQTRVNQFLTAGGLTDPGATVTVGPAATVAVGADCIAIRPVTVTYPHAFSFVGSILTYFGSAGIASTTLQATAAMRDEVAAAACP